MLCLVHGKRLKVVDDAEHAGLPDRAYCIVPRQKSGPS